MQENSKICKSSHVVFRSHYPNSTEFFLTSILGHNSRVLVEFIFRILIISHFSVKKNNYAYLLSTFFGSALRKKNIYQHSQFIFDTGSLKVGFFCSIFTFLWTHTDTNIWNSCTIVLILSISSMSHDLKECEGKWHCGVTQNLIMDIGIQYSSRWVFVKITNFEKKD